MSVGTILLIILVIALLGGFSGLGGGPFYGTGYYGGGALGLVLVIVLFNAEDENSHSKPIAAVDRCATAVPPLACPRPDGV